ncbi:hypothetical protein G7Y89_g14623 [Cudoniella acicularis]|uniref:Uncharacterized protein n=1 Tax=Cudoniella acicularis TaxID=354080 RepID=A0A8H4R0K9_9HELO|nr:hypothetical protein G7Y89_g14623 [Cudoniella acicularis]
MEKYSPLDTNDPSESQPVLQNKFSIDSEHDPEEALPLNLNKKSWFVHQGCFALSFHLLLIIFYTFLAVSYSSWQAAKYSRGPQNIKSPARDIVEFEPRRMDNVAVYSPNGTINPYKSTQYNGYPRPELENAWSELTQRQLPSGLS